MEKTKVKWYKLDTSDPIGTGIGLGLVLFIISVFTAQLWIIGLPVFLICYFAPSIIGYYRNHKNFIPIVLCNTFLGFTGILWFICLVWSFSSNVKQEA